MTTDADCAVAAIDYPIAEQQRFNQQFDFDVQGFNATDIPCATPDRSADIIGSSCLLEASYRRPLPRLDLLSALDSAAAKSTEAPGQQITSYKGEATTSPIECDYIDFPERIGDDDGDVSIIAEDVFVPLKREEEINNNNVQLSSVEQKKMKESYLLRLATERQKKEASREQPVCSDELGADLMAVDGNSNNVIQSKISRTKGTNESVCFSVCFLCCLYWNY